VEKLKGNAARRLPAGLKPKDLVGIPWRVAFALQADGWYLRSDIIWHKPNPMPESVTDRPTKAHEYLFLLTKQPTYYYDADAVKEEASADSGFAKQRARGVDTWKYGRTAGGNTSNGVGGTFGDGATRNRRSVWTVATRPYKGAHFATFPPKLIEPCILAGCPVGGTVLDPFGGSGTTGAVAEQHGRNAILIELNAAYIPLQHERLAKVQPTLGVA
jgi:DNA modification methylase